MPSSPAPADICTGAYFYQRACDQTWFAAWPGGGFGVGQGPGQEAQGCSAHTKLIVGDDWKWYAIIDQGPTPNGYKRPADPRAATLWDVCYNGGGLSGYNCDAIQPPQGTQVPVMKTLAQVPPPMKASFSALFQCNGPVPPPPGNQYADWIEQLYNEGITAGCGAPSAKTYCPDRPVTRAEMAVFLLKTKYGANYQPAPCVGIFTDVPCGTP